MTICERIERAKGRWKAKQDVKEICETISSAPYIPAIGRIAVIFLCEVRVSERVSVCMYYTYLCLIYSIPLMFIYLLWCWQQYIATDYIRFFDRHKCIANEIECYDGSDDMLCWMQTIQRATYIQEKKKKKQPRKKNDW